MVDDTTSAADATITTRAAADAQVRAITRRCRGPLTPEAAAEVLRRFADGDEAGARAADQLGRSPCGADFNDVLCAGAYDGADHAYRCPVCGLEGSYTAPWFPDIVTAAAP